MIDRTKYDKKYRKDHKDQLAKDAKQYRKDHKDEIKQYRKDHKDQKREYDLKSTYNLSYEDWLAIWEGQGGKCIICGKSFKKPSDACVDHNHKISEVRGLLCHNCNLGIGFFNDDPELTVKATEYLLKRKKIND